MDPSAREDFIFMTIVAAICFYDPDQSRLRNPGMVTHEQNIFYSILRKLITSQSRCCSSCTSMSSSSLSSSSNVGSTDVGSTNRGVASVTKSCERTNIIPKELKTAQVSVDLTGENVEDPIESEQNLVDRKLDPTDGISR